MKRALRSIALVSLFTALLIPATAFAKGPIAIKTLPYTIAVPGSYTLSGNLTYTANSTNAITISANNVTLDMGGYSLTGPGSLASAYNGISISGNGVEVRNGDISGFSIGLYAGNSISLKISNLRLHDNLTGISMASSAFGAEIKDCVAYNNENIGIFVMAPGSIILNNISYNNGTDPSNYGIYVYGPSCVIIGNSSQANSGTGIFAGPGCTVKNNSACSNTIYGIHTSVGPVLVDGNSTYNNANSFGAGNTLGTNTP